MPLLFLHRLELRFRRHPKRLSGRRGTPPVGLKLYVLGPAPALDSIGGLGWQVGARHAAETP